MDPLTEGRPRSPTASTLVPAHTSNNDNDDDDDDDGTLLLCRVYRCVRKGMDGWMDGLPSAPVLDMRPLPAAAASSPPDGAVACVLASSEVGPSVKVASTSSEDRYNGYG